MMEELNAGITRMEGIPINLISKESLEALPSTERVDFVLREVKEGKVLILEMGLSALEEAVLIEKTMKEIDHKTFIGIEFQSYSKRDTGTWLDRLLKRKSAPRMAVIGPASLLKTIYKDGNVIQTMLVTREHVIENAPETNAPGTDEQAKEQVEASEDEKENIPIEHIPIEQMGEELAIAEGGN